MKSNINRVQKYIENVVGVGDFLQSCFSWKSKLRSIVAFAVRSLVLYLLNTHSMQHIGLVAQWIRMP